MLSIDSVGTKQSQNPQTQTGAGASDYHPEPKRRVNLPMVPPGGFLRGEQFERERVVPPLSRLLCLLSCRSKKVRPRWQALAESRLENRQRGSNRVTMTSGKYHPISKPEPHRPLAPSVTCGDSSLPEGAMGLVPFHIGLCFGEVPAVNPSVTPTACQLPLAREPLREVPADNFARESSTNRYCLSSARYRRLTQSTTLPREPLDAVWRLGGF